MSTFETDKKIMHWAKGNFGAMDFLNELFYNYLFIESYHIRQKLEECKTIRGTNLYILYSDLCNKDMDKVALLCKRCPNHILEDACNRQDRSGVKLIDDYLNPHGYKVEKCPDCQGGQIFKMSQDDGPTGTMEVSKCEKCDGKGFLKNND